MLKNAFAVLRELTALPQTPQLVMGEGPPGRGRKRRGGEGRGKEGKGGKERGRTIPPNENPG